MVKRVFLGIVVYFSLVINGSKVYSQSIEQSNHFYYSQKKNSASFFVGGGYLGPSIGWNGVLEYRQKIMTTGFFFQPALLFYGGELHSDRFDYNTQYTNFQFSGIFSYSLASLMKISFLHMRLGVGFIAGAEYVQPNPIYNTKTWNFVVGPSGLASADFLINNYAGISLRYQFNYLPKAQVSKMEHIFSLGLIFKIL